jgi:hypothetical protein
LAIKLFEIFVFVKVSQKPDASFNKWIRGITNASVWRSKTDKNIHFILKPL